MIKLEEGLQKQHSEFIQLQDHYNELFSSYKLKEEEITSSNSKIIDSGSKVSRIWSKKRREHWAHPQPQWSNTIPHQSNWNKNPKYSITPDRTFRKKQRIISARKRVCETPRWDQLSKGKIKDERFKSQFKLKGVWLTIRLAKKGR